LLQRYGWTEFDEGYEVNFKALKTPLYLENRCRNEFLDVLETIHCFMVQAAPARVIEDVEA
jgi:hypothetical protein